MGVEALPPSSLPEAPSQRTSPLTEQSQQEKAAVATVAKGDVSADSLFGATLTSADQKYLKDLTLLSITSLQKEPHELEKEKCRLQTEIESIAVHNYRGFIGTSRAISDAHLSMIEMQENLDTLVATLPDFNRLCTAFTDKSAEIQKSQELNRTMLEKEVELSELLEIPMLMNACARNGLIEEALDLEAYARTLQARFEDVPILASMVRELERTTRGILQQLREQLRGQLQLPTCLRVVSYLRRLGFFEEQELRAEFLRSRNAWMTSVLSNLGDANDQPYEYLSRCIDANRVHMFEVITQYRAIFVDDTSTTEESGAGDKGLLFYWTHCRVSMLLATVDDVLSQIKDGALLANILEQAMYCGSSLARVGVDLRPLLPAMFTKHILAQFRAHMASATAGFEHALSEYDWHISASELTSLGLSCRAGAVVEYPPLAILGNALINAFNFIRHCCPHATSIAVVHEVETVLLNAGRTLHSIKLCCLQQQAKGKEEFQELDAPSYGDVIMEAVEATKATIASKGGDPVATLAKATAQHLLPQVDKMLGDLYQQNKGLLDVDKIVAFFAELYADEEKQNAVPTEGPDATDGPDVGDPSPEQPLPSESKGDDVVDSIGGFPESNGVDVPVDGGLVQSNGVDVLPVDEGLVQSDLANGIDEGLVQSNLANGIDEEAVTAEERASEDNTDQQVV